jgi:hypothetical protein
MAVTYGIRTIAIPDYPATTQISLPVGCRVLLQNVGQSSLLMADGEGQYAAAQTFVLGLPTEMTANKTLEFPCGYPNTLVVGSVNGQTNGILCILTMPKMDAYSAPKGGY